MNFLPLIYPYRKYIVAAFAILIAFGLGFYRGRVTAPEKIIEKEVPVEHIVTQTKTVTDIRYVPKTTPTDSDVDIRIPKQQLTVSVNGQRQLIHKADTEKYIFDENKLQLEQTSKASLDIKIPTVDKTRRWSIGIGASRNGAAYMLRGPLKGHVGAWAAADKKSVMGGISFDF